ncbi:13938_t:CDS:2 [Entrophospora sp. SA101]|nr:15470_t:CDS:2 [Entrophospora sp. SA101]CAJ0865763.1 13938_t:CDS:2 [Entrophospora sp. SA101]
MKNYCTNIADTEEVLLLEGELEKLFFNEIIRKQEFTQLKQEKTNLQAQLQTHQTTLADNRQQLDQLKSELSKNQQARESLEIKIKECQENPQTAEEKEIISKLRDLGDNSD